MILYFLLWSTAVTLTIATSEDEFSRLIINPNQTTTIQSNENDFFKLILQSHCIVDKTLFIRDIVEKTGRLVMLTCPRKWGKTTILSMLKLFLKVQVDEKGKRLPLAQRTNLQLFRYGKLPGDQRLLKAPLISNYPNVLDYWMGWYPVINISFRVPETFQVTEASIISFIKERIRDAFAEHKYLTKMLDYVQETKIRDVNRAKEDSNIFHRIYLDNGTVSDDNYKTCLKTLSQILHRYFNKATILMIDEYVSVINEVLTSDIPNKNKLLKFYCSTVNPVLHENSALAKAIFTGTLRTKKELSNLDNHEFLRSGVFENFVINEHDMEEFSKYLNISQDTKKDIRFWYNGYRAGANASVQIYNPFSLVKYIEYKSLQSYWVRDKDAVSRLIPSFIKNKFFQKALCNILGGNPHKLVLPSEEPLGFTTWDLETLRKPINGSENSTSGDLILKFFLSAGYLSPCQKEFTGVSEFASPVRISLCVPNQEIRLELQDYLSALYVQLFQIPDLTVLFSYGVELAQDLKSFIFSKQCTNSKVEKSLQNLLSQIPYFVAEEINETNYSVFKEMARSIINMMLAFMPEYFDFLSYELGYSYSGPDALLIRGDHAAMIDFKFSQRANGPGPDEVVDNEQDIDDLLKTGLEQVRKIKIIEILVFLNRTVSISSKMVGLWGNRK